jgi:hypothetical protein
VKRRFWVSYLSALLVFVLFPSLVSSYAYLADQTRFGGEARILVSLLCSTAPMAAGSALLLALALWSEAQPPASLPRELEHGLKRALAAALPGYLLAVTLAFAACFAVALLLGSARPSGFAGWLGELTPRDLGGGLALTLLDTALILLLARRFAVRLRAFPSSLPFKLIVIVTVTVPLRATLALVGASLLPG